MPHREAIHLSLLVTHHDSVNEQNIPMRLLYDFESGSWYVCSTAPVWRLWKQYPTKRWMTDSDFDHILREFEIEKAESEQ